MARVREQADEDSYARDARHFYDDLRAAWERALEEVAFAQVIMRHRDQIKPATLPQVSVLTQQDCQVWTNNFDKCCGQMAGHDQSRGRNRAILEPEELRWMPKLSRLGCRAFAIGRRRFSQPVRT